MVKHCKQICKYVLTLFIIIVRLFHHCAQIIMRFLENHPDSNWSLKMVVRHYLYIESSSLEVTAKLVAVTLPHNDVEL